MFFFNVMPIYALSFKLEPSINTTTVKVGDVVDIDIYLNDIADTQSGVSACTLKITPDSGIVVSENIKTYGKWQGINGSKGYSFDTIDTVLSNTKIFTISVTVNQTGKVKFTDIVCTDADDNQGSAGDKVVSLSIESQTSSSSKPSSSANSSKPASSSKPSSSKPAASSSSKPAASSKPSSSSSASQSSSSKPSSSASSSSQETDTNEKVYLNDIVMAGGTINFNKEIYEYNIIVDDLELVDIKPVAEPGTSFDVSESFEEGLRNYLITVWNKNGDSQKYIIYLSETIKEPNGSSSSGTAILKTDNGGNSYTGIFIAIIVILVLINVGRIGYNFYMKKKH